MNTRAGCQPGSGLCPGELGVSGPAGLRREGALLPRRHPTSRIKRAAPGPYLPAAARTGAPSRSRPGGVAWGGSLSQLPLQRMTTAPAATQMAIRLRWNCSMHAMGRCPWRWPERKRYCLGKRTAWLRPDWNSGAVHGRPPKWIPTMSTIPVAVRQP
jgi:hypothetical protein